MAFKLREKFQQAKEAVELASFVAGGLKDQATAKLSELRETAHDKVETGRAVVEQVRAIAPLVIAMKKAEYTQKATDGLNKLGARFGIGAGKPAQQQAEPSAADIEAFLKSFEAAAETAEPEAEHEAPAAEPAAAAPANDTAKPKKAAGKKKAKASTRKPK